MRWDRERKEITLIIDVVCLFCYSIVSHALSQSVVLQVTDKLQRVHFRTIYFIPALSTFDLVWCLIAFNYLANQVSALESSRSLVDVIYCINRDVTFVLLAGPVRNCVGVFAQSRFRGRRNSDVHQASSQTQTLF